MGAIAGPNLIVLMLTAMEHDLTMRVNAKMDSRMKLSMQSIFLATKKSDAYAALSSIDCEKQAGKYKQAEAKIRELEAQEQKLAAYDKQLEMQLTKLQNELKQTTARKDAAQKMLDQNIQGAYNYGQGR